MAIIYVSPSGGGSASGSSALNALPVGSLNKAILLAGAGGTVIMLSDQGAYDLTGSINITHGGTALAPVTIIGEDSAGLAQNIVITGTRPADYSPTNPAGSEVFKLSSGADNLAFQNMTFENVGTAFRVAADLSNLSISDMSATNVQRFLADTAGGTATSATVAGLRIENVEVHGFSENVIELKYDTHDVVIRNVLGDSQHQDGDGYAMGIHLAGTVHNVLVSGCTMENAVSSTTDYWNGDGFATESGVHNVTFENCVASGNADAGFDLKSSDTILTNPVADENAHNFRLWGDITLVNPTGTDPEKYGGTGGQYQIQVLDGASVTVEGGAFADSGSGTTLVVMDGGQSIVFTDTKFIHAEGARISIGNGILGLDSASISSVAATGSYSTDGLTLLQPPNQAPDALDATACIIPENSASGTIVGSVSGHDPDGDALTYRLSDDAGGRFAIDPHSGVITVASGAVLDFEQQASFSIGVVVSDEAGLAYGKSIVVQLTDVAEPLAPQSLGGTSGADVLSASSDADTTVSGLAGNDRITTLGGADTISGGAGNDIISSGAGDDLITFKGTSEGFDTIDAGAGSDVIRATADGTTIGLHSVAGVEVISAGGFAHVSIQGGAAADLLDFTNIVLDGILKIAAGGGDDFVTGSGGADRIFGGAGADTLSGGGGADLFSYAATSDSPLKGFDSILDFTVGQDKIDLSAIDANSLQKFDQAFKFIGTEPFSGHAGELRIDTSDPAAVHIYGDTNGDRIADFHIDVMGAAHLHATDFIL